MQIFVHSKTEAMRRARRVWPTLIYLSNRVKRIRNFETTDVTIKSLSDLILQAVEGNCPEFLPSKPTMETVNQLSDLIEKYIPPNIRDRCKDQNSKQQLIKDFAEIWSKFMDVSSQFLFQKYYSTIERYVPSFNPRHLTLKNSRILLKILPFLLFPLVYFY